MNKLGLALIMVLALTACGRKSDLVKPAAEAAQPADGKQEPAPAPNGTFILDPLVR